MTPVNRHRKSVQPEITWRVKVLHISSHISHECVLIFVSWDFKHNENVKIKVIWSEPASTPRTLKSERLYNLIDDRSMWLCFLAQRRCRKFMFLFQVKIFTEQPLCLSVGLYSPADLINLFHPFRPSTHSWQVVGSVGQKVTFYLILFWLSTSNFNSFLSLSQTDQLL